MCLANTTIQPSSSGQPNSLGQASFDYASAPSAGAFYAAIAEYQGSHMCKTAPSEGVLLVWLLHILFNKLSPKCALHVYISCHMKYGNWLVSSAVNLHEV